LQNRFVHIAIAFAMTCSAASNALANPPSMYRFIDDRGVVHFSNAPSDPRYQAIKVLRKVNPPGKEAPKRTIPVNYGYDSLIIREAKANGLEPALVKAVIAAESNFSVKAVSHAGAQGLMQLRRLRTSAAVLDICEKCSIATGTSRGLSQPIMPAPRRLTDIAAFPHTPKRRLT
jgi:hypothetical protein